MDIDHLIRTRRKTIAIIIQTDGSLLVRAPLRASLKHIQTLVDERAAWIQRKQELARRRAAVVSPRLYTPGAHFPYLGVDYPLQIVDAAAPLLRLEGSFYLARAALERAEAVFTAWYWEQARQVITERLAHLAAQHGMTYSRLRIMQARTRWGSCGAGGSLNFNWRLVLAPLPVVDYVIIHELAHLQEHNHSPAFWDLVRRMMPEYKAQAAWLKANGHALKL